MSGEPSIVSQKLSKLGVSDITVDYVGNKLNPLIHELFAYLLGQRPDNPEMAVILWMLERADAPSKIISSVQKWIDGDWNDDEANLLVGQEGESVDPAKENDAESSYKASRKSEFFRPGDVEDDDEVDEDEVAPLPSENDNSSFRPEPDQSFAPDHRGTLSLKKENRQEKFNDRKKKSTIVFTPGGTRKTVAEDDEEDVEDSYSHEEKVEIVKNFPGFKGCTDADFEILARSLDIHKYPENSIVINYGAEGAGMHIIVEGEARVFVPEERGILREGDALGQTALWEGRPAQEYYEAANGPLTTLKLEPLPFKALDIKKKTKAQMKKKAAANKRDKKDSILKLRESKTGQKLSSSGSIHLEHPHDAEQQELIIEALKNNRNLAEVLTLDNEQMLMMVRASVKQSYKAGDTVFDAGDMGESFYIIGEGTYKVFDPDEGEEGENTKKLRAGHSFGELALLYGAPRVKTVKCGKAGFLWYVSQHAFQSVMQYHTETHLQAYTKLIESVPDLKKWMGKEDYSTLSSALEEMYFIKGENVVTQGETGNVFYIIFKGACHVITDGKIKAALGIGDYFGEKALFEDEPRGATVRVTSDTCTLLALDRVAFNLLFHPETRPEAQNKTPKSVMRNKPKEEEYIPLRRLQTVGPLGQGAFGRVTLEKDSKTNKLYALKSMSKAHIVQERLKQAIQNEVTCQSMLDSDFIVKLAATYRDADCVYMALEPCFGGELFDVYNDHGLFGEEGHCRFYTACVSMGLEHMHHKRIIYRDLKLENCLLTSGGWLKLTDLGLAKTVLGKTYTVCGTTDYFAPETLRQTGHNRAVDWWALGILIYIMMTATSPFNVEGDVMATYKKIIKGFAKVVFADDFPDDCMSIVLALCKKKPEERLTMGARGVENLKDHPWFASFSWIDLLAFKSKPPWDPKKDEVEVVTAISKKTFDNDPQYGKYEDDGSGWDQAFDDDRADTEDLGDDISGSRSTVHRQIRPTIRTSAPRTSAN